MSTGPRLPLATADALAAQLMARWGMAAPACGVVGSVRRRKPDVGDLELIAPLPPDGAKIDQLYEVIADAVGVLSESDPLPFPIDEHVDVSEEARLRWRYLGLGHQFP